ncbi:MAG: hypothetical protein A2X86_13745 [Bdellovibrionales bacterium GWA2_49_15]|nr:MAG: hypothetical protein A2X86_13745 [Bdellovibrionales bacterium GWA2_49_15]HAZ13590.1 ATPase [Bdellovibrionales bacterium]
MANSVAIRNSHLPDNLSSREAATKLLEYGPNVVNQADKKRYLCHVTNVLQEPTLILLVIITSLYLFMGDLAEGMLLSFSALLVIGISLYQDLKTEHALQVLRELSAPTAQVIRDGKLRTILAQNLVPGDLISIHEGDRIPADGHILETSSLSVDESLLTGESFAVQKSTVPGGDAHFFASTLVVSGRALARVEKTGRDTQLGKIGEILKEHGPVELNLSTEIRSLVKFFGWCGAIACILIIILFGSVHGDWLKAVLVGLATQLALIPEEFPVVLTVFMALGAWRLSHVQVLVRRPNSIERLGAITTLCVDKTGTLTQNTMTVSCIHFGGKYFNFREGNVDHLPESHHIIIEYAILASRLDPFDPMEKAIRKLAEETGWGKDHLHQNWSLVQDYPLTDKLFAMSCVWKKIADDSFYVIAAKGSPEAISDLCHLTPPQTAQVHAAVKVMATNGLRVLAVARAEFRQKELPAHQHVFNFEWLGLIGMEDPLRPEVPQAVGKCHQAGIRVIMMTGDYPETALKIGKEAGIKSNGILMTGDQLTLLSDEELEPKIAQTSIFARMLPQQKLRIVKAFQARDQIVAMTGDGVNDAPGLKWADVGIAMGGRGTDVAREVADIVLLDDNFASIVAGIIRGRTIFSNIKQAMGYIASIHVPIAGLAFFPVLFQLPLILMPAHIVFLQLIIDPTCSLLFEARDIAEDVMRKPPRNLKLRLFSGKDFLRSTGQGLLLFLASIGTFITATLVGKSADEARALCFCVLVLSNVGLIIADLCDGKISSTLNFFKKRANTAIVLVSFSFLIVVLYLKPVQSLFMFAPVKVQDLFLTAGVALFIFIILSFWNKNTKERESKITIVE